MTSRMESLLTDFKSLKRYEKISFRDYEKLKPNLKNKSVLYYFNALWEGSKPEAALREAFFSGTSGLIPELLTIPSNPEGNLCDGYIDYKLIFDGRSILLEIKPWFEKIETKTGEILRPKPFDWINHRNNIFKYLRYEHRYLILSNLEKWYFFSSKDAQSVGSIKPFAEFTLPDFHSKLSKTLLITMERTESKQEKDELTIQFFSSLKEWVGLFDGKVRFKPSTDKREIDLIISLINKFIVIQIFDDLGLIEFQTIRKTWEYLKPKWFKKGERYFLRKFFEEVTEWFYLFYDTSLFNTNEFNLLVEEKSNCQEFYHALRDFLGVEKGHKGSLTHFNFTNIDEDILGHSYEVFIAQVRKEQGIYYTPTHVTSYMARSSVNALFAPFYNDFLNALERKDYNKALEISIKVKSLKILDPACGSGSFLIKVLHEIFNYYIKFSKLIRRGIEDVERSSSSQKIRDIFTEEEGIHPLKKIVNTLGVIEKDIKRNNRRILAKIVRRHIFGVDLDSRAVEIAKINIWLKIIRLSSKDYISHQLPRDTNYILPNLSLNIRKGNSIIHPFKSYFNQYEKDNPEISKFLTEFSSERVSLTEDPFNTNKVEYYNMNLRKWRKNLRNSYSSFINDINFKYENLNEDKRIGSKIFSSTNEDVKYSVSTFLWNLDFAGVRFDLIIGNPPYVDVKNMPDLYSKYLLHFYSLSYNRVNYFCAFSELGILPQLLTDKGIFAFIVPNPICIKSSYKNFRKEWLRSHRILEIIRLPNNTFDNKILSQEVNVEPVILLSQANYECDNSIAEVKITVFKGDTTITEIKPGLAEHIDCVEQSKWINRKDNIILLESTPEFDESIKEIERESVPLQDICEICLGLTPYDKGKGQSQDMIKNKVFHLDHDNGEDTKRLLLGKNVSRYGLTWNEDSWLRYGAFLGAPREWKFFSKPRILIRQIRTGYFFLRIYATYTEETYVNAQSIFNIISKERNSYQLNLLYILGILNSCLMSWYYHVTYMDPQKTSQSKVLIENARELPIKLLKSEEQLVFTKLVIKLLLLTKYREKWEEIFLEKSQFFRTSIESISYLWKESLSTTPWFSDIRFYDEFENSDCIIPERSILELTINENTLEGTVFLYKPSIGTKKIFSFKNPDPTSFQLSFIGILKHLGPVKRNTTISKLLDKKVIHFSDQREELDLLLGKVMKEYSIWIDSPEAKMNLQQTNLIECSNQSSIELKEITIFSGIWKIFLLIDNELEARVLSLYPSIQIQEFLNNLDISENKRNEIIQLYSQLS